MATDDLVMRLKATLDELEKVALAARGGEVVCPRPEEKAFIEANTPSAVLRLVQSHRDILGEYEQVRTAAEADPGDLSARVGMFALGLAVQALARGYGIEDQQGSNE